MDHRQSLLHGKIAPNGGVAADGNFVAPRDRLIDQGCARLVDLRDMGAVERADLVEGRAGADP